MVEQSARDGAVRDHVAAEAIPVIVIVLVEDAVQREGVHAGAVGAGVHVRVGLLIRRAVSVGRGR